MFAFVTAFARRLFALDQAAHEVALIHKFLQDNEVASQLDIAGGQFFLVPQVALEWCVNSHVDL